MEWLFYYVDDWSQPSNTWACTCGSFLLTPLLIITVLLSDILLQSVSRSKNTLYLDTTLSFFTHLTVLCGMKNKNTPDTSWARHSDCLSSDSIIIRFVTILILYDVFVVWLLCSGPFFCLFFFFGQTEVIFFFVFYMPSFFHFSFTLLFSNKSKTDFQTDYLSA